MRTSSGWRRAPIPARDELALPSSIKRRLDGADRGQAWHLGYDSPAASHRGRRRDSTSRRPRMEVSESDAARYRAGEVTLEQLAHETGSRYRPCVRHCSARRSNAPEGDAASERARLSKAFLGRERGPYSDEHRTAITLGIRRFWDSPAGGPRAPRVALALALALALEDGGGGCRLAPASSRFSRPRAPALARCMARSPSRILGGRPQATVTDLQARADFATSRAGMDDVLSRTGWRERARRAKRARNRLTRVSVPPQRVLADKTRALGSTPPKSGAA